MPHSQLHLPVNMIGQLLHQGPRQLAHRHARQRRRCQIQQPQTGDVFGDSLGIAQQTQFTQGLKQPEQSRFGQPGQAHDAAEDANRQVGEGSGFVLHDGQPVTE